MLRENPQHRPNIYQVVAERFPQAFGANLWSAYQTKADVLDALGRSEEAAVLRRQIDEEVDERDDEESGLS